MAENLKDFTVVIKAKNETAAGFKGAEDALKRFTESAKRSMGESSGLGQVMAMARGAGVVAGAVMLARSIEQVSIRAAELGARLHEGEITAAGMSGELLRAVPVLGDFAKAWDAIIQNAKLWFTGSNDFVDEIKWKEQTAEMQRLTTAGNQFLAVVKALKAEAEKPQAGGFLGEQNAINKQFEDVTNDLINKGGAAGRPQTSIDQAVANARIIRDRALAKAELKFVNEENAMWLAALKADDSQRAAEATKREQINKRIQDERQKELDALNEGNHIWIEAFKEEERVRSEQLARRDEVLRREKEQAEREVRDKLAIAGRVADLRDDLAQQLAGVNGLDVGGRMLELRAQTRRDLAAATTDEERRLILARATAAEGALIGNETARRRDMAAGRATVDALTVRTGFAGLADQAREAAARGVQQDDVARQISEQAKRIEDLVKINERQLQVAEDFSRLMHNAMGLW